MTKKDTYVIEISGLTVSRESVILDRIDWRVRAGEHWVILGANGSGKTSLFASLTGYLAPFTGDIKILGQQYGRTDWRDLRSRIGLVSSALRQRVEGSETALATVVSGKYAQINFWGEMTAKDRAEGLAVLDRVECRALAGRSWGQLSEGERQRVIIGRALMARPEILLLDEPCAGLDPAARENFLRFLQRLARRRGSPALVLATHHVEEIMPLFTHALLLKKGRVFAAGAIKDVLTSQKLSQTFGAGMDLLSSRGRYQLSVRPRSAAAP